MKNENQPNVELSVQSALGITKGSMPDHAGTAADGKATFHAEPARMDVVLLYEDFDTGFRTWQAFERFSARLKLDFDLHVHVWGFELLREPALREQAVSESLEADIVLLAAHGHSELSEHVKSWFTRWLAVKPHQPGALVVSLDEDMRYSPDSNLVLGYLQATARRSGLDVLAHFAPASRSEWNLTIESIRRRADMCSELLTGILHRFDAPPR